MTNEKNMFNNKKGKSNFLLLFLLFMPVIKAQTLFDWGHNCAGVIFADSTVGYIEAGAPGGGSKRREVTYTSVADRYEFINNGTDNTEPDYYGNPTFITRKNATEYPAEFDGKEVFFYDGEWVFRKELVSVEEMIEAGINPRDILPDYLPGWKSFIGMTMESTEDAREEWEHNFRRNPGQYHGVPDVPYLVGSTQTLVSWEADVGDSICLTVGSSVNTQIEDIGDNAFSLMANNLSVEIVVTDIEVGYSMIDHYKVATNLNIATHCFCDCPGGTDSCNSHTNKCPSADSRTCQNTFFPDVDAVGCTFGFADSGETCCYNNIDAYDVREIATAGGILDIRYDISIIVYGLTDVPFQCDYAGTYELDEVASTHFPSNLGECDYAITGVLFGSIDVISSDTSRFYSGGDKIFIDGTPYMANGWARPNDFDMKLPGAVKINKHNHPVFNRDELSRAARVRTENCEDDKFTITHEYDRSKPHEEESLETFFSEYGEARIESERLVIKPQGKIKTLFSGVFNLSEVLFIQKVADVKEFNCSHAEIGPEGGTITCTITDATGPGAVSFWLEDEDHHKIDFVNININTLPQSITFGIDSVGKSENRTICTGHAEIEMCVNTYVTEGEVRIVDPEWSTTINGSSGNDTDTIDGDDDDFEFFDTSNWFDIDNWWKTGLWWGSWLVALLIVAAIGLVVFFYAGPFIASAGITTFTRGIWGWRKLKPINGDGASLNTI